MPGRLAADRVRESRRPRSTSHCLANLLEHFLEEYFWKPSAIVSYSAGTFGGVRAAVALREMVAEMGMPSIPSVLPVPRVQDAFDLDGEPKDDAWHARADKFLAELEWYGDALRAGPSARPSTSARRRSSPRASGPFVDVNCAAPPEAARPRTPHRGPLGILTPERATDTVGRRCVIQTRRPR